MWLWACCSEELARAVYDSGVKNNADEGTLISAIRKLSVRAQNKLVNVVTFLGLAQDRDETIGSFCARLRGQATVCNFETDCSSSTCTNKTNYMNEMVAHEGPAVFSQRCLPKDLQCLNGCGRDRIASPLCC